MNAPLIAVCCGIVAFVAVCFALACWQIATEAERDRDHWKAQAEWAAEQDTDGIVSIARRQAKLARLAHDLTHGFADERPTKVLPMKPRGLVS